jgi:UDPglucose 6-dehydrogenase
MFNTIAGKRIAVFGAAFKANTGDTRDSPAISIARDLIAERAQVVITDPSAIANARVDLRDIDGTLHFEVDPYAAAAGAHAIALLTDWDAYRDLDYRTIYANMVKPAFVFDGRNLLDHTSLHALGFNVVPIGKQSRKH